MATAILLIIFLLFGALCGATIVYFAFEPRRWRLDSREHRVKESEFDIARRRRDLEDAEWSLRSRRDAFETAKEQLDARSAALSQKAVDYESLLRENAAIKQDIRHAMQTARRQAIDVTTSTERQKIIEQRANLLAADFMKETQRSIVKNLRGDNYVPSRDRLLGAISRCRAIGCIITPRLEAMMLSEMEAAFQDRVQLEAQRERQADLRERLRQDRQAYLRARVIERLRDEADERERRIEEALATALALQESSDEVRRLQQQLADERAANQRTIPNIEITNRGSVYVISNIGSFGRGVFKIGLSGRDDPFERVEELGGASVPFPFDVHMMIQTPDARHLEKVLHRALVHCQVNKANPRKEFFRTSLEDIAKLVHAYHPEIVVTIEPEADQYRRSLMMSDADAVRQQQLVEAALDRLPIPT